MLSGRLSGKPARNSVAKTEPPQSSPNSKDQINLTDKESRIMPISGGSFKHCYNAQVTIDTELGLVISSFVTSATNNKEQVESTLKKTGCTAKVLGKSTDIVADTGYFSSIDVELCIKRRIVNHYWP